MSKVFLEKTPDVPEERVDELEALIRKKYDLVTGFAEARQLSRTLQQAFLAFETLEGSMLGPKEFSNALSKMNCSDRKEVVLKLFNRYDLKGEGVISVRGFCDGLFGIAPVPGSSPDCRDVLKRVRDRIRERGGSSGVRGITRILRIMDDNGNKSLDKKELQSGLETYGIRLSQEELGIIFRFFDRDKSGSIDVTEFLVGIRDRMSTQREQLVRQAFLKLEKNGDGRVTMEDLKIAYDASKHPAVKEGKMTVDQVVREFGSLWNKNGDDEITIEEFIEYYNDLSVSIDSDQYFELMIRNAWHLSGGVGVAACTTTRRVLVTHLDGTSTVEEVQDDFGINWEDEEQIRSRLRKQGVSDILKVDVRS